MKVSRYEGHVSAEERENQETWRPDAFRKDLRTRSNGGLLRPTQRAGCRRVGARRATASCENRSLAQGASYRRLFRRGCFPLMPLSGRCSLVCARGPLVIFRTPRQDEEVLSNERIDMGALLWGHGRAIGRPGAPFNSTPKGTTMRFTSEQRLDDGAVERGFTIGEIPGILWTPGSAPEPAPLILLGHPGGLHKMYSRLVARARHTAAEGFAAATIELPGSGDRPRLAATEEARADLRRALEAGERISSDVVDRLVVPLVER